MANDHTIGVGVLFITLRVVVLLLHMWFLAKVHFLAFDVFLVHFLGICFFVMCGGRWWVVKCVFGCMRWVSKYPEVPKALQVYIHLNNIRE